MSRWVTIGRDRRRTGRNYCSLVPPRLECIVKKPLAALLLVPAALAALAVPAGADVPDKPANVTVPCYKEPGAARVWTVGHKLAVDNPCAGQWLSIDYGPQYASGN